MEDITLVFNWTLVIAIPAIPIDPARKYPEHVIPGLARNPISWPANDMFRTPLDTASAGMTFIPFARRIDSQPAGG
jgi:hypothetical protein